MEQETLVLTKWWDNAEDSDLTETYALVSLLLAGDQLEENHLSETKLSLFAAIDNLENILENAPTNSKWKVTFERIE